MINAILDNIRFLILVASLLGLLILAAKLLADGHKDERAACIKAGYSWSPTKYVCTVKP